jgi:hypothetical protein
MKVIVMKIVRKEGSAMVAGVIRTGVSPFLGDSLNEAFCLAVGLRAIRSREEVFKSEFLAGGGEEFGTISRAAIRQDALDLNAVNLVEVESLLEGGEDTGSLLIREERGKGKTAVIVDGDMEALDAGAWRAMSAVASGPDTGLFEPTELLDVEVEKISGGITLIANDRRFGRFERGKTVEAVTPQDAGQRRFGNRQNHEDLSIGATLMTQMEDPGFKFWGGPARLTPRSGAMIGKTGRKAIALSSPEPSTDGLLRDMEKRSSGAEGKTFGSELLDHFGSHDRGEFGISVHVDRGECLRVECLSTTLPNLFLADNLLKHDT